MQLEPPDPLLRLSMGRFRTSAKSRRCAVKIPNRRNRAPDFTGRVPQTFVFDGPREEEKLVSLWVTEGRHDAAPGCALTHHMTSTLPDAIPKMQRCKSYWIAGCARGPGKAGATSMEMQRTVSAAYCPAHQT